VAYTFPEDEPLESSARKLIVDLGSSVAASGAKNFGVLSASAANFGAFWGHDPTRIVIYNARVGAAIRRVLDLAVGQTAESERVEIRFFLNRAQHLLQFGPWTVGQFQPDQSGLNGDGTTRGMITRVTETRWRVHSGPDSVGRLWANRNSSQPVKLGLYHVWFDVQFNRK